MVTPYLDGICKTADRSVLKDFAAGVSPTGTGTFKHGIQDAGKPEKANNLRRLVMIAGGLLAGAIITPSLVKGVIGGGHGLISGKGFGGKMKGLFTGFGRGFAQPFQSLNTSLRAHKYLKNIQKGKSVSSSGEKAAKKLLQSKLNDMAIFGVDPNVPVGKMISGATGVSMRATPKSIIKKKTGFGIPKFLDKFFARKTGIDPNKSIGKVISGRTGLDVSQSLSTSLKQMDLAKKLSRLAKTNPVQFKRLLASSGQYAGGTLALMGTGGALGAAGALMRYNAGRKMGKRVRPYVRQQLLEDPSRRF